ncbi:MAG TPA: cell division protein FtsL [Smithellaceae bacterium]|jgi:cell division protein FtsL|nr:cell division protein FtsL [Syntrophaceae bacterium]HPL96490.1 cell division protein FtsL [Smithellaceae bacterium]HPV49147.1 cell division protein FtsL [Smithellaceae bacterium]
MTQTAGSQTIGNSRPVREAAGVSLGVKYPTFIVVALVLMFVAVIYVGLHIRMTRLEYETAAALSARELLQEEQKKLELELAMLKAPRRIEDIARNKLHMSYPTAEQVIVINQEGK